MTNGVAGKRRKIPKTAVPESAYGAGQHKTKIKSQGAKGASRDLIMKSTVRALDNRAQPPPKRRKGWKAKGDEALLKWADSIGRETSAPYRRHRSR